MAIPLEIFVKTRDPHIFESERVELIIDITAKGIDIENAAVTVVTTGGRLSVTSGTTDANGIFRTVFDDNDEEAGEYTITFTVVKSPFTTAVVTTVVTVETEPVEYTARDTELLIGVRTIRRTILDFLQKEMRDDPDLYPSTGATRPPKFLNSFNYKTRDFPQVITSGGVLIPRRVSIGGNIMGWVLNDDGTRFRIRGGIHDLTIALTVIAEDKKTQEHLLDKASMILWEKKFLSFLAGDITVLSINAGGETTEPWGSRLLYAGSVTANLATQWQLKEIYQGTVDTINYTQNTS